MEGGSPKWYFLKAPVTVSLNQIWEPLVKTKEKDFTHLALGCMQPSPGFRNLDFQFICKIETLQKLLHSSALKF